MYKKGIKKTQNKPMETTDQYGNGSSTDYVSSKLKIWSHGKKIVVQSPLNFFKVQNTHYTKKYLGSIYYSE